MQVFFNINSILCMVLIGLILMIMPARFRCENDNGCCRCLSTFLAIIVFVLRLATILQACWPFFVMRNETRGGKVAGLGIYGLIDVFVTLLCGLESVFCVAKRIEK